MTKRVIAFRAWNKVEKVMYTNAINNCKDSFDIILKHPQIYEVMQYTGLKDKHGVEIYEDDIVHCWGDYKDGGWGFDRIIKVELTSFKLATLEDCEYKEILGNVFENPELLEMVLKK